MRRTFHPRRRPGCCLVTFFFYCFAMFVVGSVVFFVISLYNRDAAGSLPKVSVNVAEAPQPFPICDSRDGDFVPCLGNMFSDFNSTSTEVHVRHCLGGRMLNCLVPPPLDYKIPVKWPASKNQIWRANVQISKQNGIDIKGDKLYFPDGSAEYVDSVGKLLKHAADGNSSNRDIRTVLDMDCSVGGYLVDSDMLALSIAPNDADFVKLSLERGIPATLAVLSTTELPYPSMSFDLAICSGCRIDWTQRDGILLLEMDRLLRPGGYFVLSVTPGNEAILKVRSDSVSVAAGMCWSLVTEDELTVVWRKPVADTCPSTRLCNTEIIDADNAWQAPLRDCLVPKLTGYDTASIAVWPKRLSSPSLRLEKNGYGAAQFHRDTHVWTKRVNLYWKHLESQLDENTSIRNILDMNAELGGFAAALHKKKVWIMNVVSPRQNTLGIVYDRGLVGILHDWCAQAFPSYPRTYDLIHASLIFSGVEATCGLEPVLLDMDRLLRPMGFVIVRDVPEMVSQVKEYLPHLHWDAWSVEAPDRDNATPILLARKQLWHPDKSSDLQPSRSRI